MKTRKQIFEAISYINSLGLDNSQWSSIRSDVQADWYYGATNTNEVLPPHISVWIDEDNQEVFLEKVKPDVVLITAECGKIAIFKF